MEILKPFIILTLSVLILLGCGQQTLKDEGLESKSIDEAGNTSTGNTDTDTDTTFSVSSTSPADGATGVSRTATITITFSDNVRFDEGGIFITGWTRSFSTPGSCSGTTYNNYSIHFSEDSFSNCIPDNGTVSGKTATLNLNKTMSANTTVKVKVYKTSLDGLRKTQSSSGTQLSEDYTFSFTTGL